MRDIRIGASEDIREEEFTRPFKRAAKLANEMQVQSGYSNHRRNDQSTVADHQNRYLIKRNT